MKKTVLMAELLKLGKNKVGEKDLTEDSKSNEFTHPELQEAYDAAMEEKKEALIQDDDIQEDDIDSIDKLEDEVEVVTEVISEEEFEEAKIERIESVQVNFNEKSEELKNYYSEVCNLYYRRSSAGAVVEEDNNHIFIRSSAYGKTADFYFDGDNFGYRCDGQFKDVKFSKVALLDNPDLFAKFACEVICN